MSANRNTGAPAALARLETQELEAYREVEECKRRNEELRAQQTPVGDDAARIHQHNIANAASDLLAAYDRWSKVSKTLLAFDKQIAPEKRDGEKMPVAEVKEMFAQLLLSVKLAIEDYIITQAQSAALCSSPEEFHLAHADNLRDRMDASIAKAKTEGVLPEWLLNGSPV